MYKSTTGINRHVVFQQVPRVMADSVNSVKLFLCLMVSMIIVLLLVLRRYTTLEAAKNKDRTKLSLYANMYRTVQIGSVL